ncbi:MAG: S8 family serine peptidase, partial [Kiritimatiellae bacterium]|nr:S8 family serine peptidase [Kiritimatiellia bacterium]MDW8459377.1 S8 family peptidase [Verrucomicrobiota bacterium]
AGLGLPNHWVARAVDSAGALELVERLRGVPGVVSADPILARRQAKKFFPNDTYATNQWHLRNTGQFNGVSGMDVRITNAWVNYRGSNIIIGIVDDGLELAHPDLAANIATGLSWDFRNGDPDPYPDTSDDAHGTACAGVAAGVGNNGVGISGAAPQAKMAGLKLVGFAQTDGEEAGAITTNNHLFHIKSNSWGPPDTGSSVEGPGPLMAAALSNACVYGRGGRGILLFWAAGNGRESDDNSNFDGYANSIYTIAVAAMDIRGTQSYYSEPGANIVVCAPSSGYNLSLDEVGIWTTDLTGSGGYNDGFMAGEPPDPDYVASFGGTSSATPLAAGVGALILQANPFLGWRDVQEILIRTATRNDPTDPDWRANGAGFWFNHKYGAGLINASGAVARALVWSNLGPQFVVVTNQTHTNLIPDNNFSGLTRSFVVTNNLRVEHVVATISAVHPYRGDLQIELVSPSAMTSVLATVRPSDDGNDLNRWRFMTVRHWGENAAGTWTLRVSDRSAGDVGSLTFAGLTLYGTIGPVASNRPPQLMPIDPVYVFVTNPLAFGVFASDPIDGDPITLTASNLPPGASFSATGGVGTFHWPIAAPLGNYQVVFRASDKDGAVTQSVAITVGIPPGGISEVIDFEGPGETKPAYAAGTVTLSGRPWLLSDTLIGTSAEDRLNDSRAARFRTNGTMTAQTDFTNGVGFVAFWHAKYGSDADSLVALDYSTNSGIAWINAGTAAVNSVELKLFEANISRAGPVRLRIRHAGPPGSNRRFNVDDIVVTTFSDFADADGDGMNDYWELSFFASLTNLHAAGDWDGDGFKDIDEYLAGTVPTNPASLLVATSVSGALSGDAIVVRWQSASNKIYRISRSTNLLGGFTVLATNLAATPPENVYTDAAAPAAQAIYRIDTRGP